ncbi:MAG: hypothetical protein K1X57_16845 [Gemmataceae bacterium]|nr:hypothetical protein [Gemmataceae bacterium]
MNTTESQLAELTRRVEALERAAGDKGGSAVAGWISVAGMFRGSEVMRDIAREGQAIREAERVFEGQK